MANDRQIDTDLPPEIIKLLADLPVNVDRKVGAAVVTHNFFKISPRSLERWPLPWRRVNGRANTPTVELVREAHARLTAAPEIMGGSGRRQAA
jgi:hypothetical protein